MTFGKVSSPDIKPILRALQTVDRDLAKVWRQEARTRIAVPWAEELARQAPPGALGAAAGRSIKAGTGQGVRIWMGKGQWKPGFQPFWGIEFGMDHDVKHKYIRRNRRNPGRHFVSRRVGTWAPEWIPSHTYRFRRYWEQHEDRIRGRIVAFTDEFMGEHL